MRRLLASSLAALRNTLGKPPAAEPAAPAAPVPGGPLRLLVVDDLPMNFMVIEKILQSLGLSATMVTSGTEALQAMNQALFDAVLTDCRMPGMSGFDLARTIRAREQGGARRTVIIGISANDTPEDVRECLDSGMDAFLPKPVSAVAIGGALERWLGYRPEAQP